MNQQKDLQPYRLSQEELKRIQNIELEMLLEIDRICRKCDIAYELDGGTLLGAVRHKGFIPWDDDIDIRMLRDDYDRFCEVCRTELDTQRFFLQNYNTDPGYRWSYGKLVRKGTVYKRLNQEMLHMTKGVFLDIFTCDNMPDEKWKRAIYNAECLLIRKIGYAPIGAAHDKNPALRLLYSVLSLLPEDTIRRGFDHLAYRYNGEKTYRVRTTGWYYRQEDMGYLRRWMDERCELEFERHLFYAPKDYDGYLRMLYGKDYMTPPPKEKQVPENAAYEVDLGDCGKERL